MHWRAVLRLQTFRTQPPSDFPEKLPFPTLLGVIAEVDDDLHTLIFHPASRGEDRRDLCSQSLKDYLEPAGEHQTARKERPVTHVTLAFERCCVTKMRFTRACMGTWFLALCVFPRLAWNLAWNTRAWLNRRQVMYEIEFIYKLSIN